MQSNGLQCDGCDQPSTIARVRTNHLSNEHTDWLTDWLTAKRSTYVTTNLTPVLVWRQHSINPDASIMLIPSSHSAESLDLTGLASVAMACREWKVDPIRSQSFVPIVGARVPRARWWIRPPDLFTIKRCRYPISTFIPKEIVFLVLVLILVARRSLLACSAIAYT